MFFFKLQFAHFITPSKYVNSNQDIFFLKHVQDKFIHSDILFHSIAFFWDLPGFLSLHNLQPGVPGRIHAAQVVQAVGGCH